MSNLYRSALSARLAKLPLGLPPSDEDDEELEEDEGSDSLGSLPGSGLGPPAMPFTKARTKPKTPNPDFAPISGASFFADALQVAVPARGLDVRVYYTPPAPREGVGGGDTDATVLVCHHGAGYSGLSFACLAKEITGMGRGEVGVIAVDARRHGKTQSTTSPEDSDLSVTTLVDDFVHTLRAVWPQPGAAPTVLLVGHSMGGSVVVRSVPLLQDAGYRVSGVVVLDVVEGTALDALPHMHSLLNARPDGFASVEEGVEWHFKTKTIRNSHSARVSVPSILVPSTIIPAKEMGEGKAKEKEKEPPHAYVWRTPLRSTAEYWPSWFTSLSASFLAARTARLLPLMIAQMQGKFQLVVVGGVGHVVHEDDPTHVAEILLDFWRRNDRLRMPIKVKGVGEA
ncbi:Alpha/Beta hydrolase protein [Mycena leptocephala]|nr:Alpha/Beta hydrolase protein [Mycena leptocephala]